MTTTPADAGPPLTPDGSPFTTHAADGFGVFGFFSGAGFQKQHPTQSRTRSHLVFAHATGFCGAVWHPVRKLLADHDSTTFDFRGHGSSTSTRTVRSWWEMASDVLAVTSHADHDRVIGIGHSMGGASLVMAELLNPGTFAAVVLIEPIIFGGPYRRDPDHPLVALALRRRDRFESRAAVLDSYASKPPFATWHPDALAGYVDGGFVEDGDSVRLRCAPRAEAEVFTAASAHAAWERLGEVTTPARILYGADTDTYSAGHGEALAARMVRAEAAAVPGTGHFLPMERPDVVADAVRSVEDLVS